MPPSCGISNNSATNEGGGDAIALGQAGESLGSNHDHGRLTIPGHKLRFAGKGRIDQSVEPVCRVLDGPVGRDHCRADLPEHYGKQPNGGYPRPSGRSRSRPFQVSALGRYLAKPKYAKAGPCPRAGTADVGAIGRHLRGKPVCRAGRSPRRDWLRFHPRSIAVSKSSDLRVRTSRRRMPSHPSRLRRSPRRGRSPGATACPCRIAPARVWRRRTRPGGCAVRRRRPS